ncbi:MAG: pyroglutamyl-peptidase I [Hyphomicrobiaceae bacterium]
MSKVLVTGFEAFGTTPVNPAEQVARHFEGSEIAGAMIVTRIVPNTFFTCIDVVQSAIVDINPDVVVMMGEYGGRAMITVERIAQNFNDGTRYGLADNAGNLLQDVQTIPDGPVAYHTTLPIRAMVRAMRKAGTPADISDAPGTFCCNHLMYGILHFIAVQRLGVRAGWIHLPCLPEVAALERNLGSPSMSVETAVRGVRAAIAATIDHPEDIKEPIVSLLQI